MVMLGSIAMSCGLTAVMSIVIHREVRADMIVTGFVCAVVIDRIINRISGKYRRKLAEANQLLERRVRERTADLEEANRFLRDAAAAEKALRDELMVRDRMASAGMLAAGVGHEIRSPLTVITFAAEEIETIAGDTLVPDVREMVGDIATAASAIAVILRDLSSLARPVDDPLTSIELSTVVASAARLAAYKLGPRVRLELGALDVPAVVGNAPRLVQLLLNLIVNAARAARPDAPNVIAVDAEMSGGAVVVSVRDTGTGMSQDTLARVFEPFFTTGGSTGGTGLGLPICKSIVEKMGGRIEMASELGVGTTVSVTLQAAAIAAAA